ncbi:MAG: hypothetical protein HDS65_06220 [Bacteroidales bacterium]|nr:hypothetical protein [Bacteroidales bacterium]
MIAACTLASSRDEDNWDSSIHCSYYSVLQMIIHFLTEVKNPALNIKELTRGGDSHQKIADAFATEINTDSDRASFYFGFELLKRARVKADYTAEHFNQAYCLEIKEKADVLRNKTKSYFENGKQ